MANTDVVGLWAVAEADGDFPAVIDPEHNQLTYAELAALTNRISKGLRAAGLGKGDQVTTVLPNCVEQLAVCLAAYQSGLYVTAVNWHFVGAEISYIVNDAETKAFIVHERFGDEARKALDGCVTPETNRFCVGGPVAGFRPFEELIAPQSGERPDPDISPPAVHVLHLRHHRAAQGGTAGAGPPPPGRGRIDRGHAADALRVQAP